MQQQTVQPVYFSQPYETTSVISSYRHLQSIFSGALMILAGSLSVIFSIVEMATVDSHLSHGNYIIGATNGLLCGIMIVIAGGFGVGAGRHKSRCMIIAYLVLAVVAAIFSGTEVMRGFIIAAVALPNDQSTVYVMSVLLALLGIGEFVLCLWGSILCCATGGCCGPQSVAYTTMPAGEHVDMAQRQNNQQPMVYPTPSQYPGYNP